MKLIKEHWAKSDIKEFQEYLKTFENPQKREWSKSLLNTKLPVLCLKTVDIKNIINEIGKGNYIEFLDLMIWEYYENTAINGFLITKINDFNTYKKYLDIYSSKADNWATCDLLKFNVKGKEKEFLELSKEYIRSENPFVRRIGLYILFEFVKDTNNSKMIIDILDSFRNEEHYYVNMMLAWLLSEVFICNKKETLNYLKNNTNPNKFMINKGIQKCRESRRVSQEDKDMLLNYKIK